MESRLSGMTGGTGSMDGESNKTNKVTFLISITCIRLPSVEQYSRVMDNIRYLGSEMRGIGGPHGLIIR